MKTATAVISSLLILSAPMGIAQTLEDIEAAETAVYEAWEKTPLMVRKAIFVEESPQGFGIYEKRSTNTFAPGEPLLIYVEPVGYTWGEKGNDMYNIKFNMDLNLVTADGNEGYMKNNIMQLDIDNRYRVRESMVDITLDINERPPGDYVAEFTLHDENSGESATFQMPFSISDT